MSQEKVNRYKEEKANRKKTLAKQKINHGIRRAIVGLIALVFIGWIGYSVFDLWKSSRPREVVEASFNQIDNYVQELEVNQ